jgi:hypothetical protein
LKEEKQVELVLSLNRKACLIIKKNSMIIMMVEGHLLKELKLQKRREESTIRIYGYFT